MTSLRYLIDIDCKLQVSVKYTFHLVSIGSRNIYIGVR
jgi:hypothetical protein